MKYGVVQTDSPVSRDFLFLTIKLLTEFFQNIIMWKVALMSQDVQNLKKIPQRKREKIHCLLCFFWLCWRHKISEKTYDFMWARADYVYYSSHHQRTRGHKTVGSHLKEAWKGF